MTLAAFDQLSREKAMALLEECCGSSEWAARMERARPFASLEALLQKSDEIWWSLRTEDWLEAFRAHPKLGESPAKVASRSASWSQGEQARIVEDTGAQDELRRLNREYEERFGWIFILCATGKSAADVLSALKRRMNNDETAELREAAEQQNEITKLRLRKAFQPATVVPLGAQP